MVASITVITPYHPGDLGKAYTEAMRRFEPDEWVCFTDHDAMFTTDKWYYQLQHAIERYPGAGLFTAKTNRIGIRSQVHDPVKSRTERMPSVGSVVWTSKGNSHDMVHHYRVGQLLLDTHGSTGIDISNDISNGIMICTQKKIFDKVGSFRPGFGGQDTDYHRAVVKLGYKVYLLKGLYMYHWYRQHLFIPESPDG